MSEKTATSVTVRYFALLREQRGLDQETLNDVPQTARALYDLLQAEHNLSLAADSMRVAINGSFESWEVELNEGDEVVFIPPVAGG